MLLAGLQHKIIIHGPQEPDVVRQDAGYEFCEVQGKGKGKVKVKGDTDGCRQRAWTQTDDRFVNVRRDMNIR
jgi:hypothetical protein